MLRWMLLAVLPAATTMAAVNVEQFPRMKHERYEVFAQRDKNTAWQVNWFMNRMLEQYATHFSNATRQATARVIVFSNMDDFHAYAEAERGSAKRDLAGYTAVKRGPHGQHIWELVAFEQPGMWRTLAHEGFHQFLGYQFGANYAGVPVWLNEGLAQYYETSYIVNRKLIVGAISAEKLTAAQDAIRGQHAPGPLDLVRMNSADFYRDSKINYPVTWALVYYLLHGDSVANPRATFHAYLDDVKLGLSDPATFQQRFGQVTPAWRERFEQFVLKLKSKAD
jgi:hypothetical protein